MTRKIRIIGVLLVGILFGLGACASPATSNQFAQAPADPGVQNVNAPAPIQTPVPVQAVPVPVVVAPAPIQSPAINPAPVAPDPAPVAAVVPSPADVGDFVLSNLQITPGIVKAGSDITVTVKVTNPGKQAATNKVTFNLVMEGEACPTFVPPVQDITLAGGASQQVTFKSTIAADGAGSYTVTVGQLTGTLLVQ